MISPRSAWNVHVCALRDVPRLVQRMPASAAARLAWDTLSQIMCGYGTLGLVSLCVQCAMGVLRLFTWHLPASTTCQHRFAMAPSDGEGKCMTLDVHRIPKRCQCQCPWLSAVFEAGPRAARICCRRPAVLKGGL